MKEIVYTFDRRGCYLPDRKAIFAEETHLRLVVKPHTFEMKLSDEVIRSSSCPGYVIEASRAGEVRFFDEDGTLLASVPESPKEYAQIELSWQQDVLSLQFGCTETVDNYPNCDGESDRWSTEWITQRTVTLNLQENTAEVE